MDNNRKNSFSARKAVLSVLCVFLSLILILMLVGTIYMESLLRKINRVEAGATGMTLSSSELQDILHGQKMQVLFHFVTRQMKSRVLLLFLIKQLVFLKRQIILKRFRFIHIQMKLILIHISTVISSHWI